MRRAAIRHSKTKKPRSHGTFLIISTRSPLLKLGKHQSALTCLVAWLGLVDDVNATLAANQLVVAVAGAEALEAVTDLHGFSHFQNPRRKRRITNSNGGRDRDRTCDPYDVNAQILWLVEQYL